MFKVGNDRKSLRTTVLFKRFFLSLTMKLWRIYRGKFIIELIIVFDCNSTGTVWQLLLPDILRCFWFFFLILFFIYLNAVKPKTKYYLPSLLTKSIQFNFNWQTVTNTSSLFVYSVINQSDNSFCMKRMLFYLQTNWHTAIPVFG